MFGRCADRNILTRGKFSSSLDAFANCFHDFQNVAWKFGSIRNCGKIAQSIVAWMGDNRSFGNQVVQYGAPITGL
jgi:hypothetical protein